MSKARGATFSGRTGEAYTFEVFGKNARFRDVPAVYVFACREPRASGGVWYRLLYVGQTEHLGPRIRDCDKWPCVRQAGCNTICVLPEASAPRRLAIEADLRDAHETLCNDQ